MTIHETLTPPHPDTPAGAATVADLRALDGTRALTILMFRDWFEGAPGRARVFDMFCDALGPDAGPVTYDAWSDSLDGLARHARRPLVRHGLGCNCVGADEAVVSQLFDSATTCAREDALMILALIVPADRGLLILQSVERAGLAMRRIAHKMCSAPVPKAHRALH